MKRPVFSSMADPSGSVQQQEIRVRVEQGAAVLQPYVHLLHISEPLPSSKGLAFDSGLRDLPGQLYVQFLHVSELSPSSRRFASESSRVPDVLQRKQSMAAPTTLQADLKSAQQAGPVSNLNTKYLSCHRMV